jgi:Zn-dependent protease
MLGFRISHLKATQLAAAIGKFIALLMAGLGIVVPMPMLVLLGMFIYTSAKREAELAESQPAKTIY